MLMYDTTPATASFAIKANTFLTIPEQNRRVKSCEVLQ